MPGERGDESLEARHIRHVGELAAVDGRARRSHDGRCRV